MKLGEVKMAKSRIINKCIYCGSVESLTDEHVVPFGLSGQSYLGKASCKTDSDLTSRLERHIQGIFLGRVRSAIKTSTYRPKKRQYIFPVTLHKKDKSKKIVQMHVDEHPVIIAFPVFPLPGFVRASQIGSADSHLKLIGQNTLQMGGANLQEFSKKLSADGVTAFDQTFELDLNIFARFLAKVAYCATVLHYGLDCLEETFVLRAIKGSNVDEIGHWVGTLSYEEGTLGTEGAHLTSFGVAKDRSVLVRLKLFAVFDPPEYAIVVGRLKQECVHLT